MSTKFPTPQERAMAWLLEAALMEMIETFEKGENA